jgi:hypothetical protein
LQLARAFWNRNSRQDFQVFEPPLANWHRIETVPASLQLPLRLELVLDEALPIAIHHRPKPSRLTNPSLDNHMPSESLSNGALTACFKKFPLCEKHGKQFGMDGGNKVIGLWRRHENAGDGAAGSAEAPSPYWTDTDEEMASKRHIPSLLAAAFSVLLGIGWVAFALWSMWPSLVSQNLAPSEFIAVIGAVSAPLCLILLFWVLARFNSRTHANRFARTTQALKMESDRLNALLGFISARIDASRRDLATQGDTLLTLGESTSQRMGGLADGIRKDIDSIGAQTNVLKGTAAAARGDLAIIMSHLPKAQVQMRQIAQSLVTSGEEAHAQTEKLTESVQKLSIETVQAKSLADESASALVDQMAKLATHAQDLAHRIEESQTRFAETSTTHVAQLSSQIAEIAAQVALVSGHLAGQDEASRQLITRLSSDLGDIEARFAAFDAHGRDRSEALSASLSALDAQSTSLLNGLQSGDSQAVDLETKAKAALAEWEKLSAELSGAIPAALEKVEMASVSALTQARKSEPAVANMAEMATKAAMTVSELEGRLAEQKNSLASVEQAAEGLMSETSRKIDALNAALLEVQANMAALQLSAGSELIGSLLQAKETAQQAANHAKEAFSQTIPEAAATFGEESRKALGAALTEQVEVQMREVAATTENAVAAAQKATDRLMRQMLTISETSAALEARIADAKQEAEEADKGNFARRVALLIESLNSSAIDVTKILSNEVTDTAWAAYLRGDRGIFARRAVKLIDSGEAKDIARAYAEDPDFREQVNRYIHDYEGLLRSVMSTRDGTPLSVALLSSDTGKLYVALAQAIERLRS